MKKISFYMLLVLILVVGLSFFSSRAQTALEVGDQIPSFSLLDQDGRIFDIDDYVGNTAMVIYFYPKDDTDLDHPAQSPSTLYRPSLDSHQHLYGEQ